MTKAISKAVELRPKLDIELKHIDQYAPPFKDGEGPQISKKTLQTLISALSDLQGVADGRDVIVPVDLWRFLVPVKPVRSKDGPCCYEIERLADGRSRYVGQGCSCGNSDDAQSAAIWADENNRWLDFEELCYKVGFDRAMISKAQEK